MLSVLSAEEEGGGRLDKVKQSGLLKFKVLKWPLINTSDGAKAVIFENNSKIILPHDSRLSPQANADTLRADRTADNTP